MRAAEDVVFSRRLLAAGGRVLFYPALRASHDNRTRLQPFLRNQFLVGKHTAIARRLVQFDDIDRYWLFLALLPIAPIAKLAKITARMVQRHPRHLLMLGRELPLFAAGLCAYSAGMVAGAVTRPPAAGDGSIYDGRVGRTPRAIESKSAASGGSA